MNVQQLNEKFAIPDILLFEENEHGLIRAVVTTASCTATIYLQGAHLSQWQPHSHQPVLFLSAKSSFTAGKAIRGGIPIIFPWFGPRTATTSCPRTDGPAHGFARTSDWYMTSADFEGDALDLVLQLNPNELSRSLGWDEFALTYKLTFGASLKLELTVANLSSQPIVFEEALHTYLKVGDALQVGITGLADTEYLDKTDGYKRKRQDEKVLGLIAETDRPYSNTTSQVDLEDPILQRRLCVAKENSHTTVIWNPWVDLTAKMSDMAPDSWQRMTCIETANAGENAVTLAGGEEHKMTALISVRDFDAEIAN